jgi:hypothetical protein
LPNSQNRLPKNLPIVVFAICTLTVAAGLVEGRLTNRWGEPADLVSAGQKLASVPARVGEWDMQSSQPFDDDVAEMLQCAANFTRVYVNSRTGDTVSVALLVGPPGPTAAHTPEVCYSSQGRKISESSRVVQIRPDSIPDETLWRMTFRSSDIDEHLLRVLYGWRSPAGPWRAATRPRFEYGGQPMLYKIQLASLTTERSDEDGHDPCQQFLRDFLPALDASLF